MTITRDGRKNEAVSYVVSYSILTNQNAQSDAKTDDLTHGDMILFTQNDSHTTSRSLVHIVSNTVCTISALQQS
jgi:hypothetical protein